MNGLELNNVLLFVSSLILAILCVVALTQGNEMLAGMFSVDGSFFGWLVLKINVLFSVIIRL